MTSLKKNTKPSPGSSPVRTGATVLRDGKSGEIINTRPGVAAVLKAAKKSGLLADKTSRISGRVSPVLLEQAKKKTGIEKDSDLIAFALANLALEDNFAKVFKKMRGKVDPTLDLEI
jgi:hypothetical protein